ncbi:MAG: hypothetical protein NTV36_00010 [Candidatus Staskawiczbacteria bacterium]|nr:hypothetical protein [Candidatus Staskawiczbacteria bacterium]
MDKAVIIIIILVILAGVGFWVFQSGAFTPAKPIVVPQGIILFYGDGCPHCKVVDDFVTQNKIEEKVKFTKLEVWYNKDNQAIISQVAQKCGISANTVGVPFLYDGTKCYEGQDEVTNFFKAQAGIK